MMMYPKESQCDGKESFDDPQTARKAAQRRKNRTHYRCNHCGKWHVGTNVKKGKPC